MTDLPKTVQWVLDFLNINNIPGKLDLYRLPSKLRKPKREPRPKKITNLTIELIDKTTGYQYQIRNNKPEKEIDTFELERQLKEIRARIKELRGKDFIEEIVNKGEINVPKQSNLEMIKGLDLKKDIKFVGIDNDSTLEDYKQFFLKKGIPPYKGKKLMLENGKPLSSLNIKSYNNRPKNNSENGFYNYYEDNPRIEHTFYTVVAETRYELSRILSNMVWGTKTYENEDTGYKSLQGYLKRIEDLYLECWKGDEVPAESGRTSWGEPYRGRYDIVSDSKRNKEPFPHYGIIPHALYACIMDFGFNHEELLPRLRQCKYCGIFFIQEQERKGRPREFYCPGKCQVEAGKPSRKKDNSKKKEKRKET